MGYQEPPEAQSVRSMLHITRILALIFGILLFLGGIAYAALVAISWAACTSVATNICFSLGFVLFFPILVIIWGVVDVIIYLRCKSIEAKVNSRQYESAKHDTLIWMIIGFIFGGIIIGILLLVAWLKFDPLITAQRNMMAGGGSMPPPIAPPPMAPAPMMASAPAAGGAPPAPPPPGAAAAPFCGNCGKPTTYVPQYGRYYCYDCKQYV